MTRRLAEEVPELAAGIGLATGEAVAGNVGDEAKHWNEHDTVILHGRTTKSVLAVCSD